MYRMLLAIVSLLAALHAGAIQTTTSFPPMELPPRLPIVDTATNRVLVLNIAESRFNSVSALTVIHADGRMETRAIEGLVTNAGFFPAQRKLVMSVSGFTPPARVLIMDVDTFAVSSVMAGPRPHDIAVAEATGKAYVVGQIDLPGFPWEYPGQMTGTLAEIDVLTLETQVHTLPSMTPSAVAVSPDGTRVYVVGGNYFRTGEPMPGFLNVFDTRAKALVHTAVSIGVTPGAVNAGRDLYIVTGVPVLRPGVGPAGPANGSRREIVVMDPMTLDVKRRIALPDHMDPRVIHDHLSIRSGAFDVAGQRYFAVMSTMNLRRFVVVDLATGAVRESELEGDANALGINPVLGQVLVPLASNGYIGIFDMRGERIDSVPFNRAALQGEGAGGGIAYHPVTGDAYVTAAHERTVMVLRAQASHATQVVNLTDLWWNPDESGWGLFLDHQATRLFGVLFTHAADGSPTWLVMSKGERLADGTFRGSLYRTSGPREQAIANLTAVGTMWLTFGNDGRATMTYDIHGQFVTRAIERQRFSASPRNCGWTVGPVGGAFDRTNFTALWFNAAEPGWGLAISQLGDIAFGVMFTFDAQNRPTWTAMSNGVRRGPGSFAGELYKSQSSSAQRVGLMSIDMAAPAAGSVTFNIDGLQQTKNITRQVFAPLTTSCTQ